MESWIHVDPNVGSGNDTVQVTVDPNPTNGDRVGTIDVATSTLNKTVIIKQSAPQKYNLEIQFDISNNTVKKYIVNNTTQSLENLTVLFLAIETDDFDIFNIDINFRIYNGTNFIGAVKGVYIEKESNLKYNIYGQFKENEIRLTLDFNS